MGLLLTLLVSFVSFLLLSLLSLLTIAFFTLFERKVIGLIHSRVGPTNVSFWGLLQPLLDAFNLLTNSTFYSLRSNTVLYSLSPHFGLAVSILISLSIPFVYSFCYIPFTLLFFIVVGSILVFAVLVAGWSSNSNYSFIGSLRSVAQSISYEAVITTLIIYLVVLGCSFSVLSIGYSSGWLFFLILPIWLFGTLAESHRAPFDFSESESELVSGFNTEYSGAFFAFIFLTEYGVLLVSCNIITYLLFSSVLITLSVHLMPILVVCSSVFFSFLFIWVRVTYVRYRYDLLMALAWNSLLPVSLFLLIISIVA